MLDLSKVHNPYDFSNPVSDQELFIGRKDELRDIRYYLDHAKTAPRPINIALLGPRASGKTSLLNMCEIEAKKRDFCTVRINLDEGDVKTQLSYFYKVFDGIFSAVCELGLYGGIVGKTYETYIEMTNAYEVPEDKTFCPCLFPIQYAKAMSSRNVEASISDFNFMRDLIKIRDELKKPIALLFDECNVLATSRVLLEKIRNIFMNTSGYMLVFTGTADLFPVMDEIFSPIIRQFKKINVSGFEDKQDTEDCIRKPLEKIGLKAEAIFEREALRDIEVVHDLSGGKPYEIQLICHFMFRRVQEKRANKMKIDLSLLEEVRRELETSQDITERPIITKIRNLSRKKLSALRLLCSCDDCASFDQIWIIEYIFNGEKKWTRDQLYEEFIYFIDEGIIKNDDDKISFSGDDFDRIYVKYFAREQKIILEFREYDLKELIFARMRGYVRSSGDIRSISLYSSEFEDKIPNMINELALPSSDVDVFVENPILAGDFYEILFQYRDEVSIPYIRIEITFPLGRHEVLVLLSKSEKYRAARYCYR